MSVRTVFLARLFGLYCLIMAAAMLPQPEAFATIVHAFVADAPLALIAGVFTLFGGLALVLLHNYWSGGALTVIITLIGWLTLIKAVVLVVLPSSKLVTLYSGRFAHPHPDLGLPFAPARDLSDRLRLSVSAR